MPWVTIANVKGPKGDPGPIGQDFIKPMVGSTSNLNAIKLPGGYPMRFATNPNGVGFSGFLIVGSSENGTIEQITQLFMTQGGGIYFRACRNGVWDAWGAVGPKPALSGATDINTIFEPGEYPVPGAGNPNGPGVSGTLYVRNAGNASLDLVSQMFVTTDGGGIYYQSARGGNWTGWTESGAPKDAADKGAARHLILLSEAKRRRGGRIGTGGRGVVSLRFDHHTAPFQQYFLPLLKKYRLPWSQVYNSNSPYSDDTLSYSQLESMCINNGGEVWNHGGNHGDASSPAALRREIVASLAALQAGMPNLAIEGWAPPGVSGGYGGITDMRTVNTMDTLAGRMMLANHAFISGYIGSHYRPLGGDPAIGHSHYTMDNAQVHHWSNAVNKAIATSTGIAFMVHPSAVPDGQTTVAILDAAFANIAAKRDAGELVVLSPSASLLADAGTDFRRNLLGQSTMTANTGITLVLDRAGGSYPLDFRGAVHELTVSGATTLTATDNTGKLNATVTETTGSTTRLVFNVPTTATTLTLKASKNSTGAKLTAA